LDLAAAGCSDDLGHGHGTRSGSESAVRLGVTEAPGVTWTSDHFQVAALPTLLMNFKTIQVEVQALIPEPPLPLHNRMIRIGPS
jgi:hypothetical protein